MDAGGGGRMRTREAEGRNAIFGAGWEVCVSADVGVAAVRAVLGQKAGSLANGAPTGMLKPSGKRRDARRPSSSDSPRESVKT